jgi:hypothetical protein
VTDRTEDGRQFRILVVVDEYTRECLAFAAARSFTSPDVVAVLQYLFAVRGTTTDFLTKDGSENGGRSITPILSLVLDQSLGGGQPSTQLFQVSIPGGQSHANHAWQPGAVLRQASKVDGTSFTAASPSQFSLLFTRIPIIQPEHAPKPPA